MGVEYGVTYWGNGEDSGSVPVDANRYMAGDRFFPAPNIGNLTKAHYTFRGWNTSEDGSGTWYMPGIGYTFPIGDLNLFVQFEETPVLIHTEALDPDTLTGLPRLLYKIPALRFFFFRGTVE